MILELFYLVFASVCYLLQKRIYTYPSQMQTPFWHIGLMVICFLYKQVIWAYIHINIVWLWAKWVLDSSILVIIIYASLLFVLLALCKYWLYPCPPGAGSAKYEVNAPTLLLHFHKTYYCTSVYFGILMNVNISDISVKVEKFDIMNKKKKKKKEEEEERKGKKPNCKHWELRTV